ncbi:indolepyruvate ferredoxin oxidoreductase family protein [Tsukamurella sp. 8F]|uniref:indolepyruvate ferredoxin oxidoreductase family protein n=1 Tax=unclassified Tsukamurella TaxID=2633480 RepID=UPI0023B88866|nr:MULTISPECIES: indolepyruvate ferredoxin oxidoreductase family protein [unclassified Tsukamurella]MDF0531462.1 indolepyruvate ferredoxin oxidoreductase family protein [Tsukamurella sp. 8J]MDF0587475.1 indolepyruvate ferredoxin oxidoreductase family protein [Tsukamurella sp. 8F]
MTLDSDSPFDVTGIRHSGKHDLDPRGGQSSAVESFSLDDRYTREQGTVYLTGIQALVRMVRDRARLDRRQNLATASLISGYEGSPLAGYDLEIARRMKYLSDFDIVHRPGLNEELAATSVMGSQVAAQVAHLGAGRDGVVGYWYGKAPGLDRATDALRHANIIGTHPRGGAVALVGDDPGAKSSSVPCASEMALADLYMPILYPADSQDILDLGVHAAIMSRVSGLWTSLKISAHVADGASTADVHPDRILPVYGDLGTSPHVPSGKLLGPNLMELEQNQLTVRLPRAMEYARINRLNRIVVRSSDDRIGIVAAGKTYLDVREGLRLIGVTDADLHRLGIRILKVGMVYPFEREILSEFVQGLDEVIVVEEKRDFIETMMRDILFRRPDAPRIVGKANEDGSTLFSRFGELDVDAVSRGLASRLARVHGVASARVWLDAKAKVRTRIELPLAVRSPYFCSGCPHNSSTKVSEDTLVGAGIGCHAMVVLMDPQQVGTITGITQMGGEGAQWLGMAPFVDEKHFVQNLGDGTFMHSGSLALRAAVASGENVTYKLLFNGTVAMTGGQDPVGQMTLPEITRLIQAERVQKIVVTSDDPKRTRKSGLPHGVEVRDRADTLDVQRELAGIEGVTVLIHDQHCAAEKRRKRKRGAFPTPNQRVVINERLCEGCGDCGEKSNCLSVHPVETEYGRKTRIDQSSCNLDFSCLKGDCPSFVTVTPGAGRVVRSVPAIAADDVAAPDAVRRTKDGFAIRVTGIGGTGVVTVSQVLATAAVLDGNVARTVDMTGLAQKGGAVVSDIKVSREPVEQAAKVASGDCDVYLSCDGLVGVDPMNLKVASPERTTSVVSTTKIPTGAMVIDTSVGYPETARIHDAIDRASLRSVYLDPGALVQSLFGDEQFANMLMVGAAYQTGALPISAGSIESAIELNGVAVDKNLQAFRRGRQAVADPAAVTVAIDALHSIPVAAPPSAFATGLAGRLAGASEELAVLVARRVDELVAYQSEAYARRYAEDVARVFAAERRWDSEELTAGVAQYLHKLMAYKDEYEVARLTQDAAFARQVADEFGADAKKAIRLHPPTLRELGMKNKMALGEWVTPGMKGLARMKRLRGTRLDPFGRTEIRRTERALVDEYRDLLDRIVAAVQAGRIDERRAEVVSLAALPDMVRGYEGVKMVGVAKYRDAVEAAVTRLAI